MEEEWRTDMTNPYKVLGVDRSASDTEIKKAYRKLSRIYHPDANINNPNKDVAEEKFKEVQEAYEAIITSRKLSGVNTGKKDGFGNSNNKNSRYGSGNYQYTARNEYGDTEDGRLINAAIIFINGRYFSEAMNVLVRVKEKKAIWYYLSAKVNFALDNEILAIQHAEIAYTMEPNNLEYRQLYEMTKMNTGWYSSRRKNNSDMTFGEQCCVECVALGAIYTICFRGSGILFCI